MDDTDRHLIAELRSDARLPVATLAVRLGVSRATVRNRIDRLVADGVIQGFTIKVSAEGDRQPVRAIMLIEVEGKTTDAVFRRLHGFPEVRTLHATNGRWDIVAELATDTLEAFDRTLTTIRLIDGIASTETSILLSSRKQASM
ncbi:Lrp/AsnC family transcriptional regulator [Thalassobaculum sp.]|uniref:Lrp/AsnC family transcriptional regulator n=1 Tax=Thalassobaculum sp. TaxID=2022740 RepID=UPI0032EB4905